jgi:hypothetical protein
MANSTCAAAALAAASLALTISSAMADDGDAISELSGFISRQIADNWSIQLYAFTGFSDSSADWGAGIQFSIG